MTTDLESSEDDESGGYTGWIVGAFVLAMIFVFPCTLCIFGPKRNQKSVTDPVTTECEATHPSTSSSAYVSELSLDGACCVKCLCLWILPISIIILASIIIAFGVANMNEAAMWEESATIANCTVLDSWTENCRVKFKGKIGWGTTRSDHCDVPYIFTADSKQC